jgi:hypothetical protein
MSADHHESARAARQASTVTIAIGLSLVMSSLGCAPGSDNIPTTDGVTTQNTGEPKEGDALPNGAISFFNSPSCPSGWAPFSEGGGRISVPTIGSDQPLIVKGAPLKDGEDRAHGHSIQAEASLTAVSYVGAAGGGNHGVAQAKTVTILATGEKVSSGLPYVQLLTCKKLAQPRAGAAPIPHGLLIFYNGTECPEGFTQPMATQGRMMVGAPDGAPTGLSFGGTSLKSGEGRAHTHDVSGTLTTTSHGIALASGCCGDGYAKNGDYPYAGNAEEERVELPTVQVLQCQKM